eukprot:1651024-Prymnesium_polylepis.1
MGWVHTLFYVSAPEKVVGMTLAFGEPELRRKVVIGIIILDAAAVGAIVSALISGITPLPLMTGYKYVLNVVGGFGDALIYYFEAGLAALIKGGILYQELRNMGYHAAQLKDAGCTCAETKQAGFGPAELKEAGFKAMELKDAGFT